jgi:hypothetical protein
MEKDSLENWQKYAFIFLILLAVLIVLIIMCFRTIPAENEKVIITILALLVAKVGSKVDYDFGSSAGSKRNADELKRITATAFPTGGAIEQRTTTTVNKEAEVEQKAA